MVVEEIRELEVAQIVGGSQIVAELQPVEGRQIVQGPQIVGGLQLVEDGNTTVLRVAEKGGDSGLGLICGGSG